MSLCDFLRSQSWLNWLADALHCEQPIPQEQLWTASNGPISVSCSSRYGGAISSIKYNGIEFIDDTDHGRQCQVALQIDGGGEGNNPTEAGSLADAGGYTSTSSDLSASAAGNRITTSVRMAYWIPFNGQKVSDCHLVKTITITDKIRIDIALAVSNHRSSNVEVLTGYLLASFSALTNMLFSNGAVDMRISADNIDRVSVQNFPNTLKWSATKGFMPMPAGTYNWTVYLALGMRGMV